MDQNILENKFHTELMAGINSLDLPTYVYSYPSKRTYRPLNQFDISKIWENDEGGNVNLYFHIPFCEYRCTYCTLFATIRFQQETIQRYVEQLVRQIQIYGKMAGHRTVSTIYFGGGTPTVLSEKQFKDILSAVEANFPSREDDIEITVEGSPDSLSEEKLLALKELGVNRISIGLQTMHPVELKASGRPYSVEDSVKTVENIADNFEHFNLDLIYGLTNQTKKSWFDSLKQITDYNPSTISLYPVVARPLTSIERTLRSKSERYIDDETKYAIFDENVKFLNNLGYRQESFTRFTKLSEEKNAYAQEASDFNGTPLIGFGAGARSYKGKFHYSFDYSASTKEASNIIENYLNTDLDSKNMAQFGITLDEQEERRRFVLLTLTLNQLNIHTYNKKFSRDLIEDFCAEITALEKEECIRILENGDISLTEKGFKFSSLIARLFYSENVVNAEKNYKIK